MNIVAFVLMILYMYVYFMYVLCTPICCAPTECSLWRGTSYRAKGQWTSSPVSWLCVRRERGSPVLRRSSLWTMRLTCMDQLEPQVHSPAPGALDSMCDLVGCTTWQCVVRWTCLPQRYVCICIIYCSLLCPDCWLKTHLFKKSTWEPIWLESLLL